MKLKKILIYLAIFIGIVLVFDLILMPLYVGREEVKVPNVVGMTYEQGKALIEQANLEPVFGGERYDSKYPKGTIILQRPGGNKIVKVGRRIYLIVSGGNIKVEVPNVRFKSIDEARIILSRAGLSIEHIFEDTLSDVPRGIVTSQSFNPGEMVEKGTPVSLWVSVGTIAGNIEVPEVVGKSISEARRILEFRNLQVGRIVYQTSTEFLPNTVMYQYPSPGTFVQEFTAIDLVVVKEKVTGKEIIE